MKKKEKEKELKCGSLPTADIVRAIGKMDRRDDSLSFKIKMY